MKIINNTSVVQFYLDFHFKDMYNILNIKIFIVKIYKNPKAEIENLSLLCHL